MSFFVELKASLEEAVEIKRGTKDPARVTRYERDCTSSEVTGKDSIKLNKASSKR